MVIGIALLLNYAYTHIGPAGRVALSYTGAFALLISGIVVEHTAGSSISDEAAWISACVTR